MADKIDLKEDRDFFIREFRKNVLNESTGGYLWNLLGDLDLEFDKLTKQSKYITEDDVNKLKRALNQLEGVMVKVLKGKGFSGW